jgi:hypothetical protein
MTDHHIWCNFSAAGPRESCRQCAMLFKKYPPSGKSQDDLLSEHFPEATPVPSPEATGRDE